MLILDLWLSSEAIVGLWVQYMCVGEWHRFTSNWSSLLLLSLLPLCLQNNERHGLAECKILYTMTAAKCLAIANSLFVTGEGQWWLRLLNPFCVTYKVRGLQVFAEQVGSRRRGWISNESGGWSSRSLPKVREVPRWLLSHCQNTALGQHWRTVWLHRLPILGEAGKCWIRKSFLI